MPTFRFELVSPERLLLSEEVESVVIPGTEGDMTVMALHAPVMTSLKPGIIMVRTAAGKEERYVVFGGFADILPEACTVLAEASSHIGEFDSGEITRRIEETRQAISAAPSAERRTALEEFLHQLVTLAHVIVPA